MRRAGLLRQLLDQTFAFILGKRIFLSGHYTRHHQYDLITVRQRGGTQRYLAGFGLRQSKSRFQNSTIHRRSVAPHQLRIVDGATELRCQHLQILALDDARL